MGLIVIIILTPAVGPQRDPTTTTLQSQHQTKNNATAAGTGCPSTNAQHSGAKTVGLTL